MSTHPAPRSFVIFVNAFIVALVPSVGSASEQKECSLETLSGDYLVTGLAQARLDQRDVPTFPRIHTGRYGFDGKGNVSAFVIENQGGQLLRTEATPGTYTVDPARCVATVSFGVVVFEIFLSRDGNEGYAVRTDGPKLQVTISTRYLKRTSGVGQKRCSLATLSGEYLSTGMAQARVAERDDPTFPRTHTSYYTFDGKGGVVASFVENQGGELLRADRPGTYTMDADHCVATISFPVAVFEFIFAPDGSEGVGLRTNGPEGEVTISARYLKRR